nr:AAA family ATPase [Secundilactobacillus collinoides]
MKLKSLEISGFKSFADDTKIDFETGVTGIVGLTGAAKATLAKPSAGFSVNSQPKIYGGSACRT